MTHRTIVRIAALLAVGLGAASGKPPVGLSAQQSPPTQSGAAAGQTRTRLADGRVLIIGGERAPASASIWDPGTQTATTTIGFLTVPRAWHTATLLSDGTVLIAGGRNALGPIGTAEIFEPATGMFVQISMTGAVARADHTATLLLDGRVLVAGGTDSSGGPLPIEIWDVAAQSSTAVGSTGLDRQDQRATLASDGTVLLTGGKTLDGRSNVVPLSVDPSDGHVTRASVDQNDAVQPKVASSIPAADAADVDTSAHVGLRFSVPVVTDSVTNDHVTLTGPDGIVNTALVTAEEGRLVFVWPDAPLADGTAYSVTVGGLTDASGHPIAAYSLRFTTKQAPTNSNDIIDREAWTPNPSDGERGWQSNRPPSPWESLAPLMAAKGVTAVSGRVLRLDGSPLKDVTLTIEGHTARTDASGRFLVPLGPWTSRFTSLAIDARTANKPNRTYGFYEARIGVAAAKTNVLPFTIWSPLIDTAHQVTIPSPTTTETLITTPTMPGLELHLPVGTVIQDEEHRVARTVSLTPIPLDRTPFPLPDNATFSMYFTIQPGGAYLSTTAPVKGGWLVYPNLPHLGTGRRVQFFTYDPEDKGWYPYGMGTVTGPSVTPDPTTRLYGFTGASFNGIPRPDAGPPPGDCCGNGGDPVNLTTGIFSYEMTDLSLPDVLPLVLARSYNSRDFANRMFGTGMSSPFGIFEYSEGWPAQVDLYLPDGGKVHFDRISDPALPVEQTVLAATTTPTGFYGARMTYWQHSLFDTGWTVRLLDGTEYDFPYVGAPLQAIRDRHGNEIRLSWNLKQLQRVTSPNGRWLAFTYGPGARVSQVTDNIGRTVGYTYDINGNLLTVTDPDGHITSYGWTANNQMASVKPRNLYGTQTNLVTNTYTTAADSPTPVGWVKTQTHADAGVYQFAYTVNNGISTQTDVTDPRGYVERVTFSGTGYSLSHTRALGQPEQRTTTTDRPGSGNFITTSTDALNAKTVAGRDALGNVTSVTRCPSNQDPCTDTTQGSLTYRYAYDPRFQDLATATDPLNHTTTYAYDDAGNLTGTTDPLQHQTTFGYNGQGQLTSVTDALQHSTSYSYTGGILTSVTDALSRTSRQFMDAAGRPLNDSDQLDEVTMYSYDGNGRLTAITYPDGTHTQVTYFPDGQVHTVTDANQHTTTYGYDVMGHLQTRTDPLGRQESFQYDLNGNPSQWSDRQHTSTSRTYDALDRLHQVMYADGSIVTYSYDARDRITQIDDTAASEPIVRAYDDMDLTFSETTAQGILSYEYDAAGRRHTMTVQGQPQVVYDYDQANRLTSISSGTLSTSLEYDEANRRTSVTLPNQVTTEYSYDAADQLIGLTYRTTTVTLGTLTYDYDQRGRRTSVGGTSARTLLPIVMPLASYDAANQLLSWAGSQRQYDDNGSLVSDGLTSYVWDARRHLVDISGATSSAFMYDSNGRRIASTVNGATTQYLYDGSNVASTVGQSGTSAFVMGLNVDEWLTRSDSAGTHSYLADGIGSIIALTDSSGSQDASYTFGPHGMSAKNGTTSDNLATYTGRESDASGLLYYRARFYDPSIGRFISEDPIGFGGGLNVYAYAANDPADRVDPLGLADCDTSSGPRYDPGRWNAPGYVDNNNCYTYAADVRYSAGMPKGTNPGGMTGHPVTNPTNCAELLSAARRDGLKDPQGGCCPRGTYKVNLYVSADARPPGPSKSLGPDYHWIRQDSNGMWSSKHGGYPVGPQVSDPDADARAWNYTTKCGTLCATASRPGG